jgi:hypothetical protein
MVPRVIVNLLQINEEGSAVCCWTLAFISNSSTHDNPINWLLVFLPCSLNTVRGPVCVLDCEFGSCPPVLGAFVKSC